jgi:hypothetical protein
MIYCRKKLLSFAVFPRVLLIQLTPIVVIILFWRHSFSL